jgi:hypothetical protein
LTRKEEDSTIVRWSADFKQKFPLIGWIIARVTKRVIQQIVDQIEADDMDGWMEKNGG